MTRLVINLLGPMTVTIDGQAVTFSYEKVRALLAYLSAEQEHPLSRARLVSLLWPDQPQTTAQDSLRQALSRLRSVLDDRNALPPFLIVERDTIQLNPKSSVTVDLSVFQDTLTLAAAHHHRNAQTCVRCAMLLEKAAKLIRGSFLEDLSLPDSDIFENWASIYRERLRIQTMQIFSTLAHFYERYGDTSSTLSYAARQIDLDPYHEPAHCQVIRALVRSGQRSQAVIHFNRLNQLLSDDLGISPAAETLALMERIKRGQDLPDTSVAQIRNLPIPLNPLVGRAVELSELAFWLSDPDRRLISIVGPGGVGKTRLLIEAVRRTAIVFPDGVVFCTLSKAGPGGFLAGAIAEALGLPGSTAPKAWPPLIAAFREREMLLVLDGFEHVLEERERVSQLLESAAGLVILLTSRERLGLPGEWVFELGGLDVPPPVMTVQFESYSAVELFNQCARQVNQSFEINDDIRACIGDICRLVGGMPLAIGLAAAWVHSLPCQEIASEIRRGLDFLSTRVRTGGSYSGGGHSSIRAVFEQSWKMLDEEERAVFPRLSVFRGGFDRFAAEDVSGAKIATLARLVDKSLLRKTSEDRYDLHDLLNQFGMEKLQATGEEDQMHRRHFEYYYQMAEKNESLLNTDSSLKAFFWLIRESANLRAALAWASNPGQHGTAPEPERAQLLAHWMHPDYHQWGVHVFSRQENKR